jgi:transcriptional regulator with XRE-family HTH domain
MTGTNHARGADLPAKIARLVEERGWNQEDFARIAKLNRHTVRQILQAGDRGRRLRNATISQCADALGLTVTELRTLPLERLLPRMHGRLHAEDDALKHLFAHATLPELVTWLERNPERASRLGSGEIEELLAMQAPGGPLARIGVERYVDLLERRRRLVEQISVIAGTEYLGLLEQFVGLVHEKVNPGGGR